MFACLHCRGRPTVDDIDDVLTEYAIEHIDWPEGSFLDEYLMGESCPINSNDDAESREKMNR